MTDRPDLKDLLQRIAALPKQDIPAVLVALTARALEADPVTTPPPAPREQPRDRWLTVAQVAERLGRVCGCAELPRDAKGRRQGQCASCRWVYRRARRWGFCRKEGRALVFSERGLERHFNGGA